MTVLSRKPGGSGGGGAPSGPAGGDLGGSYPNPEVDVVDNDILGSGTPGATTYLRGDRAWVIPPGHEFAYVEFTAPVTVNATVEASASTVVSAGAVVFDGSTRVLVEFFSPDVLAGTVAGSYTLLTLWDGASDLGRIGVIGHSALTFSFESPFKVERYLTPTAASHTYIIKTWRIASDGTVSAGAGGTGVQLPGFIRITKA